MIVVVLPLSQDQSISFTSFKFLKYDPLVHDAKQLNISLPNHNQDLPENHQS